MAAHDVGALGYFAGRPLVDLAGLVAPDAIPYLGDPAAMAGYVRARGAEYLVLPEDRRLVPRQATDRIVPQPRIEGRVLVRRWPFGWCWFRPSAFLNPFPIPE